jgi:hypothetical protein
LTSLFARLTQWFADAQNGVSDFFAKIGHFDEVCAKNSDGTETCVDGDQLKSLLESGAAGAATAGSGETAGTSGGSPAGGETPDVTASTTPTNDDLPADENISVDEPADAAVLRARPPKSVYFPVKSTTRGYCRARYPNCPPSDSA